MNLTSITGTLFAAAMLTTGAVAGSFSGGFNPVDFPLKYSVASIGVPFSVEANGGFATIEKPITPIGESGVTFIIPNISIVGDFRQDVQIDFSSVNNFGPNVTIISGLSVNFGGVENSSQFAQFSTVGGSFVSSNFLFNGIALPTSFMPAPSVNALRLRVERSGDHVTTFIADEFGSFNQIDTIQGADFLRPATFYMSLNAFNATVPSASAKFSKFSVQYAAVPEPASWAMMIAGFGMVGAAARSRRRVAVAA